MDISRRNFFMGSAALNTTVAGVYAHMSALKGGETLKIPQFRL